MISTENKFIEKRIIHNLSKRLQGKTTLFAMTLNMSIQVKAPAFDIIKMIFEQIQDNKDALIRILGEELLADICNYAEQKEMISCICLTCGIRNDHSNPNGFCQNGHDDWLEYRDVMLIEGAEQEPLKRALKLTDLKTYEFRKLFLNNNYKQFTFIKK